MNEPPHNCWIVDADDLLSRLRGGLEVYRIDRTSSWALTRTKGVRVSQKLVESLAAKGVIHSVYDDYPADAYHLGRTLDIDGTLEARKRLGRKDILVYVGDAPFDTKKPPDPFGPNG